MIDIRMRWGMCFRLRSCVGEPEAEVFEDLSDRLPVLNKADQLELSLTVGTDQGICLVDFLNQPSIWKQLLSAS